MFACFQHDFASVQAILHGSESSLDIGVVEDGHGMYHLKRTEAEEIENLAQQSGSFGRGCAADILRKA